MSFSTLDCTRSLVESAFGAFSGLIFHHIVTTQLTAYQDRTKKLSEEFKAERGKDIQAKTKLKKQPDLWVRSHRSGVAITHYFFFA